MNIERPHDVIDAGTESCAGDMGCVSLRVLQDLALDQRGWEWERDVDVREWNAKHLSTLFGFRLEARSAGRSFRFSLQNLLQLKQ